ncbi:MAG: DUF6265 family protein [Phycisphaerales bacterium]|nr:hypothetical protein [Planctomycetota bacterium]
MMPTRFAALAGVLCLLVFAGMGEPETPNQPAATPLRTPASFADIAFIPGNWSSRRKDRYTQEVWTTPEHGSMLGMFRWFKHDGSVVVYELLTITEKNGSLELRITHTDGQLGPIANLPGVAVLEAVKKAPGSIVFGARENCGGLESITYKGTPGSLRIEVSFAPDGGKARPPLLFECTSNP